MSAGDEWTENVKCMIIGSTVKYAVCMENIHVIKPLFFLGSLASTEHLNLLRLLVSCLFDLCASLNL